VSIFLATSANSASECANGNNEVFKRSRVALRSGTGKRGREARWSTKLGIGGAAAFQFDGRGPVRDDIWIFLLDVRWTVERKRLVSIARPGDTYKEYLNPSGREA
jgi:hypothetical protein